MLKAFVLITTEYGYQQEVCNKVQSIPEVKEAYKLHGTYDLIVDIEADDIKNLEEVVHRRIRCLDKVRSTITLCARMALRAHFSRRRVPPRRARVNGRNMG